MMATASGNKIITKQDFKNYLQQGISYPLYKQQMADDLVLNDDQKIKEYINLNQRRMHRVENTYTPSAEISSRVNNLHHKTYWMILTEHWCGDASQSLPVFNKLAEFSNGKIEMKLVYRDRQDELMNAYLTRGTRSIPKLIQLDKEYNVTGIWGPRPTVAQKMVKELKANLATAATYANELHLWYAKNRQQDIETEIGQLIFRANIFCPDCLS